MRPDCAVPVALNTTALLSPLAGIGRYTYELALGLNQLGVPLRYFSGGRWSNELPTPVSAASTDSPHWLASVPGGRWLARQVQNRLFVRGVRQQPVKLYHDPNYLACDFDGPLVITAHDASWVRFPEAHPAERVRLMERYFPHSLARANRVIVDSDFVAREMQQIFGVPTAKLRTVYLGVAPDFAPMTALQTQPLCQRLQLQHGAYVLAVGTLEPRKNLATLIEAYSLLPAALSQRFPLVVAGKPGWRHAAIDRQMAALERAGALRILGHVAEADLPALYAASALFVYPSLYEGFGLPPLEAMASGVPVIVTNRASLPEVVGDAAIQIEALDAVALAAQMTRVLDDSSLRAHMAASGLLQAQAFSWPRCARQTLDVYQELLA